MQEQGEERENGKRDRRKGSAYLRLDWSVVVESVERRVLEGGEGGVRVLRAVLQVQQVKLESQP